MSTWASTSATAWDENSTKVYSATQQWQSTVAANSQLTSAYPFDPWFTDDYLIWQFMNYLPLITLKADSLTGINLNSTGWWTEAGPLQVFMTQAKTITANPNLAQQTTIDAVLAAASIAAKLKELFYLFLADAATTTAYTELKTKYDSQTPIPSTFEDSIKDSNIFYTAADRSNSTIIKSQIVALLKIITSVRVDTLVDTTVTSLHPGGILTHLQDAVFEDSELNSTTGFNIRTDTDSFISNIPAAQGAASGTYIVGRKLALLAMHLIEEIHSFEANGSEALQPFWTDLSGKNQFRDCLAIVFSITCFTYYMRHIVTSEQSS